MPTRKFALKKGEEPRIEITWRGLWKDIRVLLDGEEIGTIAGSSELKAGKELSLGKRLGTLRVQLVQSFGSAELQVLRNGHPLPGSGSDPEVRFKAAWAVILFIAAFNLLVGLAAVVFDIEVLAQLGLGIGSLIVAAIYLALGLLVRAYRSPIALGIAIGLFAIDGVLTLVTGFSGSGTPPVGGVVMRIFLLLPMIKGFAAIRELKAGDRGQGVAESFE
jgi:hypothetical protein